jgi:hypothetical protein
MHVNYIYIRIAQKVSEFDTGRGIIGHIQYLNNRIGGSGYCNWKGIS